MLRKLFHWFRPQPIIPIPCKKCGGEGKIVRVGNQKEYFICRCSSCWYTPAESHEARCSERSAIFLWNKRNEAIE